MMWWFREFQGVRGSAKRALLAAGLLSCAGMAWAQSNFTPLEQGDLEERPDRWAFSPGLQLSGDYRLQGHQVNSGDLPPTRDNEPNYNDLLWLQELRVRLRSTVHRNLSVNLEISAAQGPLNQADVRTVDALQRQSATESQKAGLEARQAYLEYNSNPKAIVKFGKQAVNLGDRQGKVFAGILSGITQQCPAATWCYELGALKMGKHAADWLYYGALDYPFFEKKNNEGKTHRLHAEVFRLFYTERNVPLGKNLGPTERDSENERLLSQAFSTNDLLKRQKALAESSQIADQNGNPFFYDAVRQEYFGLRLGWQFYDFELNADMTANQGKRQYHLGTDANENRLIPNMGAASDRFTSHNRATETVSGWVGELNAAYQWKQHRFGLRALTSTGDKEKLDPNREGKNFLRVTRGYHEIVPGSYRGTNFYFNGNGLDLTQGTGLGHSVNNMNLVGLLYSFMATDYPLVYRLGVFGLSRSEPVLNVLGEEVKAIGMEVNNTIAWKVDKNLHLEGELNLFRTDEAFSYDDQVTPLEDTDDVVQAVARVSYSF